MKHYYIIQYRFSNPKDYYYLSTYGFSDNKQDDIERSYSIITNSNGVPVAIWKIKLKSNATPDNGQ